MYWKLGYEPGKDDVVAEFYFEGERRAAERIAAESSVGTWTDVKMKRGIERIAAKVFSVRRKGRGWVARIAYPVDDFEKGNIPQLLSSIAGNIFGMKTLRNLRLEDASFPRKYVKSFPGPSFGLEGIRKLLGTDRNRRPHMGTIVKPKMGWNPRETARIAYECWTNGLDLVKDDENLTDQRFCRFGKRVEQVLKAKERAETETGEKKIYCANITGPVGEMIRRAELVESLGGEVIMIDVVTVGFSALQYIRELFPNMIIHGHRAMHAAMTRNRRHGISMLFLAKLLRLAGVDQLHIGTAVGKMEGRAGEIRMIRDAIEEEEVPGPLHQKWYGMKPVMAVCSGGLHPGLVPRLVRLFGMDMTIQAGGGVHGHPDGAGAGARAMRQAVEAVMEGKRLQEYAKTHEELRKALEKWGG